MVRAHADGAQGRKGKKSGRPPGGSRPDHALTAGKNYFFSVTMRFVSTTSKVSPVFKRPQGVLAAKRLFFSSVMRIGSPQCWIAV